MRAPLADLLAPRRWIRRHAPFAHYLATDVFRPEVHRAFRTAFAACLARGFGPDTPRSERFRRLDDYDAHSLTVTDPGGPFGLFLSSEWHDLIATIADLPKAMATRAVRVSLHHHHPGSAPGTVHNDYNPGWFAASPGATNAMRISDPGVCSYHYGSPAGRGIATRRYARAAAMLYYLGNPPWRPGEGGETGLFGHGPGGRLGLAGAVPPHDNSLLVFACTPWSYHGFLSNRVHPRNSLILWIHVSEDSARRRWGRDLVEWPG